jgi:hypothetical protein
VLRGAVTAVAAVVATAVSIAVLSRLPFGREQEVPVVPEQTRVSVMDAFDGYILRSTDKALRDVEPIRWIYELSDQDLIAPEPNPACYGTSEDPTQLQWLLDAAREKLGVEDTVFSTEKQILPGSQVTYYLDDSILVITWKEIRSWAVYTVSEVKVAHASQFRRYICDGEYGSKTLLPPTTLAAEVNAVTASNGDFYMQRSWGLNVYQGEVMNLKKWVDTCCITEMGDMLFIKAGTFETEAAAQQFVDDNGVRFSLAFGPILVENGVNVTPSFYPLGEIDGHYARSALCQKGQLHYLLVAVNSENGYSGMPTSFEFGRELEALGVDKAFSLDGGRSAAIVTNDRLINRPVSGSQRNMSHILYFATAIPEARWREEP